MKQEFITQKYYLKWACSFPSIIVMLLIQYGLYKVISNETVFYIACFIVAAVVISIYYLVASRAKIFDSKGYYWIDDDKLYIELNNKTYEIDSVKSVMGGDPNIFLYYYAYLQIKTESHNIKIYGESLTGDMEFRDSTLNPLFELIIQREDLVEKKILGAEMTGTWYEKKK